MRLEAIDLACVRGGRRIFQDVNFSLGGGEALAVLQPKAARNSNDPTTLGARIVVWLARRVGARSVEVRTIYHAMHCRAEHCYAALRLLIRNGDIMLFSGPPPMVMLRTAPGAIEARPSATAGASSSTASTA